MLLMMLGSSCAEWNLFGTKRLADTCENVQREKDASRELKINVFASRGLYQQLKQASFYLNLFWRFAQ